jgi:hypothetical protein
MEGGVLPGEEAASLAHAVHANSLREVEEKKREREEKKRKNGVLENILKLFS